MINSGYLKKKNDLLRLMLKSIELNSSKDNLTEALHSKMNALRELKELKDIVQKLKNEKETQKDILKKNEQNILQK